MVTRLRPGLMPLSSVLTDAVDD